MKAVGSGGKPEHINETRFVPVVSASEGDGGEALRDLISWPPAVTFNTDCVCHCRVPES